MSHLFQRPLCEMGRAYDFAYRPTVGDPAPEDGGGCDDRPHSIELYAAEVDRSRSDAPWQAFLVCPEHETQLRRYDERLRQRGVAPRFRT
jgi:hypothetical protein